MLKCLICGADKEQGQMHVIVLTEAERQLMSEPLDQYVYCKPCWGVLSNPATAPALMSGIAKAHLQKAGVFQADQLSDKFRQDLADRTAPRS